jgi:PAS domain S-box-containing protein
MGKPLRVLVIEDSADDTLLVIRALQKGGYDPIYERVETAETMRSAIREKQWDIIICDYKMPKFTAPSAIAVLKETNIDIPLLIVSGAIGEETAVKCIRLGARDYIMKNNLSRLCPTINRELEETKGRNKQKRSEEALRESEKRYRELTDFLPISTFEVDAAGNIITFNRAALEVFRYNQEDYKEGMTALQFFAPEEWQRVGENLGQVIQGTSMPGQEYTFLRKDGSTFVGLIYASPSIHENKTVGIRGAIIDITQRKLAEEELVWKTAFLEAQVEASIDGILVVDDKGKKILVNANFIDLMKVPQHIRDDTDDKPMLQHVTSLVKHPEQFLEKVIYLFEHPHEISRDEIEFKDRMVLDRYSSPVIGKDGKYYGRIWTFRNITERKRSEEALRENEKRYRYLVQHAPTGIYEVDFTTRKFLSVNDVMCQYTGYTREEFLQLDPMQLLTEESLKLFIQRHAKVLAGEVVPDNIEFKIKHKNGSEFWALLNVRYYYKPNNQILATVIAHDITERKLVEEALRRSEMKFRTLYDSTSDAVMLLDEKGFFDCNKATLPMFGYATLEEFCSKHPADLSPPKQLCGVDSKTLANERIATAMEKGSINFEWMYNRNGTGETFPADVLLTAMELDGKAAVEAVVRDITDRKQAEEDLRQAEEKYRSIFENSQEGIFRSTPDGKMIMANQAMAKMYGYESPEEMMASVTDVAHQHYVYPEDRRKLKEMIEEHGFIKGHEAQNCRKDGSIIWISRTMHAVHDEKGQITYYDGIIEDITNRKHAVERIKKALAATVQAIAVIVETRDPYTAGHQRRVADLARAIATEMNLPTDKIDGIQTAAVIHDLGKISVPAEILTKPTKLTDLEFGIIKTHAQSGYDILKDIEFPWPIARMVLEHHERMNGSGYPNGLLAEEMLLESRILAVADVVESMASHRPYRPSLGIEAALEEIEKNRGTLYDNAVADACLRLFREKGYQLQ